jgi:hypothetical protein
MEGKLVGNEVGNKNKKNIKKRSKRWCVKYRWMNN